VIGAGYQATIVATTDGRVLNGLLVEDTPQRVVLKLQGGKLETVPRDDLGALRAAEVPLMPEDLEKQLQPQEIADLFSYLGLDRPPTDPSARRLPGLPEPRRRDRPVALWSAELATACLPFGPGGEGRWRGPHFKMGSP
jgi:hypothetical protein